MDRPITLEPSPTRRALGITMFWGLAVIFLMLCVSDGAPVWVRALFAVLAGLAYGVGERLRQATRGGLTLTSDALVAFDNVVLFDLDEVESIDSSLFSFKPPTGFVVVTKSKQPFAWRPGLWWRIGRRVGIGGVTSRGPGKAMAELLRQEIKRR